MFAFQLQFWPVKPLLCVFPRRPVPRDPWYIHKHDMSAACAASPSVLHRGPLGCARGGTKGKHTYLSPLSGNFQRLRYMSQVGCRTQRSADVIKVNANGTSDILGLIGRWGNIRANLKPQVLLRLYPFQSIWCPLCWHDQQPGTTLGRTLPGFWVEVYAKISYLPINLLGRIPRSGRRSPSRKADKILAT